MKTRWIVLGILTAWLWCWMAAAQTPPFTRLWLGQELWKFGGSHYGGGGDPKEWQSMPGSILNFHCGGRRPLPAPQEFVIPLDKPLPIGNYRLFVKNFYEGRMQATLGDITQDLKIVRFDWSPGKVSVITSNGVLPHIR